MDRNNNMEIGPQYEFDDEFKAKARLHQSRYRTEVFKVGFNTYGNRLTESDGKALLNYYDKLNVHSVLRNKYPKYSKKRDADMLRSEHIPFNMFAPLKDYPELTKRILQVAFGISCTQVDRLEIEWAPKDQQNYLGDHTAFDVYLEVRDDQSRSLGIGVEVKYTERSYKIGTKEAIRVSDLNSSYWTVSKKSGAFIDNVTKEIASDDLRQIWRNHLLGLAMCLHGDIQDFVSIILHPHGNKHFNAAIGDYQKFLSKDNSNQVRGCTFEKYIAAIDGSQDILDWKYFLNQRYIVC